MTAASEFSRPVEISRLPDAPTAMAVEASAAECAALSRRFSLLALERLTAELKLEWIAAHLIRLDATLSADIVQECVVTLEPVPSRVEERFVLLYGAPAEAREVMLNHEEEVFEPIVDGRIDLGEAVAQQLSLAIDPFPRAPFAALAQWSKKG
jgi:uncharacterized metal-binding protein YceD (DUF177 family)